MPAPAPSKAPMIIGALVVLLILFVVLFAVAQAKGGIGKSSGDAPVTTAPAPAPAPAPPPVDPCAGLTDTSLASSVTPACLQKVWKDAGCNERGTIYPSSTYQGWWNQSPNGATTVWCDATHSGTQCGAGSFKTVKDDMHAWATLDDPWHKEGCGRT